MKTLLRLALGYSSMVPLQSWLTLLGGVTFLVALLLAAVAFSLQMLTALTVVGMVGAVLVVCVPALVGGAAMRLGSSRSMLYLRPHGRIRMLAAAMLVITILAALVTLPVLMAQVASRLHGFTAFSRTFDLGVTFATAWNLIAGMWLVVFVMSGSRLLSFFVGFLPMMLAPALLAKNGKFAALALPGPYTWFAIIVVGWLLFAIWYLQARSFRTARWWGDKTSQTFENSPMGVVASLLNFSRGAKSVPGASSQLLLGATSPFRFAFAMSAWLSAFFVFFSVMGPARRQTSDFTFILLLGSMSGVQLAYMTIRRARLLWLRVGSDRASVFALAERKGLAATLLSLALIVVVITTVALLRTPERVVPGLLFAMAQAPVWAAGFYCGMSLTRGWAPEEILLCIGAFALFVFEVIALKPGASPLVMVIAATVGLVAAGLLRNLARRRWMALDWRVARLPAFR